MFIHNHNTNTSSPCNSFHSDLSSDYDLFNPLHLLTRLTPFSFIFFCFYSIFIYFLLFCPDFYSYWVVMECSSLMFIGICYSFISVGFSNIMLYFVVQALSSVNIFVFYCLSFDILIMISLFLNLAVFPFYSWLMLVVSKVNSFVFLLLSTAQNLPSLFIFLFFLCNFTNSFFTLSALFTLLSSSLFMYGSYSLRTFLAFSSVGGNCWFLLACLCGVNFLLFYIFVYSFSLFFLLSYSGFSVKLSPSLSLSSTLILFALLFSLGGFPPFPLFFINAYIVYTLLYSSYVAFSFTFFLFIIAVYILSCYARFSFSYVVNIFSSSSIFLI